VGSLGVTGIVYQGLGDISTSETYMYAPRRQRGQSLGTGNIIQ
jgi:hypothetical protein